MTIHTPRFTVNPVPPVGPEYAVYADGVYIGLIIESDVFPGEWHLWDVDGWRNPPLRDWTQQQAIDELYRLHRAETETTLWELTL